MHCWTYIFFVAHRGSERENKCWRPFKHSVSCYWYNLVNVYVHFIFVNLLMGTKIMRSVHVWLYRKYIIHIILQRQYLYNIIAIMRVHNNEILSEYATSTILIICIRIHKIMIGNRLYSSRPRSSKRRYYNCCVSVCVARVRERLAVVMNTRIM